MSFPPAQNPFADMRFRNVFGASPQDATQSPLPSGGIGMAQDTVTPPTPTPNTDAITDAMSGAAPPAQAVAPLSNVMSQKLQEALDMMPQRSDYKPTKFRKIIAAMAGVGARDPEEQQRVMDEIQNKPYYQDMNDWLTHVHALMQGATEEDRQNINRRVAFFTGRGLDIKESLGQQGLDIKRAQLEIAKARADAYISGKGGNWQPLDKPSANGNVIFYKKGAANELPETYESEIPFGTTKADLLKIGHGYKTSEIAQRGDISRDVANINAAAALERKTTPAAKPVGPETPQQKQTRLRTRAVQAYNEHPEWRGLIDLAPQGDKTRFEIKGPSAWQSFTDKKTDWQSMQHDIYQYIYGGENTADTGNVKSIVQVPKNP